MDDTDGKKVTLFLWIRVRVQDIRHDDHDDNDESEKEDENELKNFDMYIIRMISC